MKVLKTIIGIVLIIAAVFAIYYWNMQGKERLAELEAEKVEVVIPEPVDPNQRVYDEGKSYFKVDRDYIKSVSSLLIPGDFTSIYSLTNKTALIKCEIAYIDEFSVEVICSIDEYLTICDNEYFIKEDKEYPNLIFAMEDKNG